MKKFLLVSLVFFCCLAFTSACAKDSGKTKFILLVSEQNIEGPQRAWWASEVDLSVTEAVLAERLLSQGYEVLEPSNLGGVIKKDKAFRIVDLSEAKSVKLGNLSRADFVVLGKAVATAGGNIPQSSMRSCFSNITGKLIRVKDGKVLAYLNASASSAHMDIISGGREALIKAADDLATKIIEELSN
ncbi:hypothetical protein ACFLZ3_04835 [Candidatus Omnitrophota bacterium]